MAAKKKTKLDIHPVVDPQTLAHTLAKLQREKELIEVAEKKIKDELLAILKKQGVRRVDLDDGRMYIRVSAVTFKVVKGFADKAMEWAKNNNALKVDTGAVKSILKLTGTMDKPPIGFQRSDSEYLRISRSGEELSDDE